MPLKPRNLRGQELNPVFHFQTKKDDNNEFSHSLIKNARKTGCLKLAGRGLSSVPEKVWNIHEAEQEDIDSRHTFHGTQNTEEDAWWNQKPLTNLDLSSNVLKCISPNIQNLADLTVLLLHDNALTILPKEIGQLTRLTRINLSRNKLTQLPCEFYRLRELKQLNLSHNELTELDVDITDLVMLEELDLSNNQLTLLPRGIGLLVRLLKFNVSNNKLTLLPRDIVNLRMLQRLDLSRNELECLPEFMGELRRIEFIYSQHNDINNLPNFTGCDALKELHLANNAIVDVPADFCESLPNLKILDLRDNKIEKLPDEIAYLQALIRLDLANNSINSLPNSLAVLANLINLQLDGNPIRSIRRDIIQGGTIRIMKTLRDRAAKARESLPKIEPSSVQIGENENMFPDKFKMRKTQTLSVVAKSLTEIPDTVFMTAQEEGVRTIDLCRNKLTTIPDGLSHMESLASEINISHNCLTTVASFICQFNRIAYLNLSANRLSDLPMEFGALSTLRELNIANNRFTAIPNSVYKLTGLEILLAKDNQIEKIDASEFGLGALSRLATLDLANNNIDHVPPILGNLKRITTLEITGNRFRQPRHQVLEKGTDAIMSYLRDRIPT